MSAQPDHDLTGCRVVITREVDDAAPLATRLAAWGAGVWLMPANAFCAVPHHLPPLHTYDWVVFTSRNAVTAVSGELVALPDCVRVAAVGPSTARELRRRGLPVHLVPQRATAAGLAGDLGAAGRVLLLQGAVARPELREMLEASGTQVDVVVVYKTEVPLPDPTVVARVQQGAAHVMVVASPAAFETVLGWVGSDALQRLDIVCIGPTTAAAARRHGFHAVVAPEPSNEGLAAAVVRIWEDRKGSIE